MSQAEPAPQDDSQKPREANAVSRRAAIKLSAVAIAAATSSLAKAERPKTTIGEMLSRRKSGDSEYKQRPSVIITRTLLNSVVSERTDRTLARTDSSKHALAIRCPAYRLGIWCVCLCCSAGKRAKAWLPLGRSRTGQGVDTRDLS